ncbi:MAG: site-2 protease family protein [Candidatus Lokiarchaeota archaeon]|nr:site-2 protease family protein [Candidatus Lokiarchaeota archaeon]
MALFDTLINILTNPFFIGSAIFWLVCYILIKLLGKKRKYVNFFFPFLVMFKTKWLNHILKKIARACPKLWRWIWNIGIFVSFGFTIFGLYFFTSNLIDLILDPSIENAIAPLIPGVTIDLPMFTYLILPILFVITIHEFSHAMAAEADNISIKSTGIFGAGVFFIVGFGAFVEIDEYATRSKKVSPWTRLRIAGAGTFSNAIQTGIALILMLSFVPIISIGYGPEVIQIDTVLPASEGGYNYGNLFEGDVILSINDTQLDLQNNIDLNTILNNNTDLQCSIGDQLDVRIMDRRGDISYRNVTLGHHFFIGFQYQFVTNSEIEITEVYTKFQGGNNFNLLNASMRFNSINGTPFNKALGLSPEQYLHNLQSPGQVNLTEISGVNISINVDYIPLVFGAFEFRSFFTGLFFEEREDSVIVTRVLKNSTESGINEGLIEKGDIITSVEGTDINLTGKTFEEFLLNDVGLVVLNPTRVAFGIQRGTSFLYKQILFIPIPKSYVFIGIQSSPYWIPKNSFTRFLGGNFPIWLEREIFYFYMVAFSVTLFNMLPLPIFDGNRILREIVHWIIGTKLGKPKQKKIKIFFDPEESDYQLMEYNITKIIDVEMDLTSNPFPDLVDSIKYIPIDSIQDGYIDTIKIDLKAGRLPDVGTPLIVAIEIIEDEKAKLKNGIILGVGLVTTCLILANFILSYILLGNITFWI